MNTVIFEKTYEISTSELSLISGGATDWKNAAQGAVYGAGIGVSLCAAGGMMTAGATWVVTGACAWAGAKIGSSVAIIADNIFK
ncbi:bacteriocin [Streptococcus suis]|uniref:bacteriocin n=1 Tax=Streptococcus suis TaxID=1307 RepID=UPI000CF71B52|nr:bacteriocin [Streptococcus suis]